MRKVIWIVNEYNGPGYVRTRQIVLSQYLKEHGYEVYIIAGSSDNKGEKNAISGNDLYRFVEFDGANFIVIKTSDYRHSYGRVLVALQFQHRVWKLRNKLPRADVIVSDFAGLFGNVFLKWKKRYGTRIIFDILDLWPEGFVDMGYLKASSPIVKILYNMEHKSYREADGIIFSFQGGKSYIVDKGWSKENGGDVDTSDIGYLNNGVDLETADKNRLQNILEDADLDTDKFKVVYLGSISAFNGLDVLVETAKCLQERKADNVSILVYGYGNQEERLKKMVEDYRLKNIKFKGKLDKKYALSLLSRSDLNIFTFKDTHLLKYGISPNKLFMYFASGKPVLSMIKPAYDLVEEKNCGISVNNDPEVVADALVRMSQLDKDIYQEYCVNARKTAEEYDYKNLVKELIRIIER